MLGAKRMRAHAALFSSLFGVTLVISALGVGIGGYLSSTAVTGVRDGLAAATGTAGAVRVEVRRTDDPATQDAAVREVVATAFSAPVTVDRTVQGAIDGVIVDSVDGLDERATLVDGAWPVTSDQASMQADAAAALSLTPGDTVTIADGVDVTLAATWRATDPLDPFWFGETAIASGESADGAGPLVIDESVWDRLDTSPFARWTVSANTATIVPADLADLTTTPTLLQTKLKAVPAVGTTGIVYSGDLADTTAAVRASIDAVSGVAPVALLLIAAIGIVSLAELGRLLVGVRLGETALLRSRGASARWVATTTLAEVAVIAVPAAGLGALVGALVVLATTGRLPDAATLVTVPIAVAIAAVGLATFAAASSARRAFRRDTANDSGRARQVAGLGFTVIVVAAAAFAVWQFRLYGSPLVPSAAGGLTVDPVAVLATPLSLLAVAVIALALFPAFATLIERIAARGTTIAVLPAWQLSRRVTVFATPVLIVALASGGVSVAAAYSATWSEATDATRLVRNGADVRVVLAGGSDTELSALPTVTDSRAVLTATTQLGDDSVDLISYDEGSPHPGIALADDATAVTLDIALTPASADAPTSIWVMDADARVHNLPVINGVAALPEETARTLVALDLRPRSSSAGTTLTFAAGSLAAVTPSGTTPLDVPDDWSVVPGVPFVGELTPGAETLSVSASIGQDLPGVVRFMPRSPDAPVPAAVSESLAARTDLEVGDPLSLDFTGSGRTLAATVDEIVPVVPGMRGEYAALVDLVALDDQQLRHSATVPDATERWLTTSDPAGVEKSVRAVVGPSVRITTTEPAAENALLGSARVALWWGAIGALLLAVVSVSAVAGALLRARSSEVIVLRAVGVTGRQQSRARRRELAILLAFAVVTGAIGGALVSALTVSGLARSTVLDPLAALPTPISIDVFGLAAALLAAALGLVAVTVVYSSRVARQADTLSARDEVR